MSQPSATSSKPPTPHLNRLANKVALITGAASPLGFGAAIATRYAAEGCSVVIGDLDGTGAAKFASSLDSARSASVQMDVTSEASWKEAVQTCLDRFGRLDIVVNNAGTTYRNKPTAEVSEEEYMRVFDVNVKSVFWSVRVAVPVIVRQGEGGSLINISSTGSIRPRPGLVWYNASKGAVSNVRTFRTAVVCDGY